MALLKLVALCIAATVVAAADYRVAKEPIADSYIVVFKKDATAEDVSEHMGKLSGSVGAHLKHEYSINDFRGYAATMDKDTVGLLMQRPEVEYIEEDGVMRSSVALRDACVKQEEAVWGLVRSSERALKIDGEYIYNDSGNGKGVTAYIIDTGIYTQHSEFEGRASWGTNTVDNDDTDGNGHGTHVAGTVGGKTFGVAKDCDLVAVKVLSAEGSGSTAGVIAGIQWVADKAKKPATANLSLGGGFSTALNSAVTATTQEGIVMVVAAGNENANACFGSPSSSGDAITVVASDNTDTRAYFSNYGACTNIIAPGVGITSAWINGRNSINTISGTSMASPHVCGVVAKYMSANKGASVNDIQKWLDMTATDGAVQDPKSGTPNKLLYADCTVA
jgi:cerevisin/serine protease